MAFVDIFPHIGSAGSLLSGLEVLVRFYAWLWAKLFGKPQESTPEGFVARPSANWADLPNLLLAILKVLSEINGRACSIKEDVDYCRQWLEFIAEERLKERFEDAGLEWDGPLFNPCPRRRASRPASF
ncbi:hypothetical protein DHEL01_v200643 [Diaporthe helianthi]|uniref:Uncharacterized protein n=1 Tax=Diaporthe helianthi TaxID=158607 RepID=A0A2P5IEN7_DIAHE|nr:hypothetical protein DHEL01_v200643 [Diaporthe helianthi]